MKKIIPYLSTKTILGFLLLFSLTVQNTTSIKYQYLASANSEDINGVVEIDSSTLPDSKPEQSSPDQLEPAPAPEISSPLVIYAINPGYTIDGAQNVGELIELRNTTDASLSLAGYTLRYTNSSGKQTTLSNFSEGSSMVGEFLLLRYARSTNSIEAEAVYSTTLAMSNASLELLYNDEVVDQVCWSKKVDGCTEVFTSSNPSTLVRDATGKFTHIFEEYFPHYDPNNVTLQLPPELDDTETPSEDINNPDDSSLATLPQPLSQCRGLEFTEILTYYADNQSEQFVELYNATDQDIDLMGCSVRYKKKVYSLSGKVPTDGYFVLYPSKLTPGLSFTKNPSSSNTIELLDTDETVLDILVYSNGQKKSTSYAKFIAADGSESWDLTYNVTPGDTNIYQEFRTCPAGKVINPATGNCIKVTTTANSITSECPAGKYRNPLTGRCKNIESTTTELKSCAEGYERNPETNRCRKIKAENDGAGYALVPTTYSSKSTFVAFGIVVLLVSLGAIYIILQFRHEIVRATRKIRQRFYHIRKDLIARCASFHRHKKP